VSLRPGDTLMLYSDGLTDARVEGGDGRYGGDALQAFASRQATGTAAGLVRAVTELLGTFLELDDDVAVMALSVHPRRA
jgi:sigma-B regulation protein RsbU (phosphoserine phosphatase)